MGQYGPILERDLAGNECGLGCGFLLFTFRSFVYSPLTVFVNHWEVVRLTVYRGQYFGMDNSHGIK